MHQLTRCVRKPRLQLGCSRVLVALSSGLRRHTKQASCLREVRVVQTVLQSCAALSAIASTASASLLVQHAPMLATGADLPSTAALCPMHEQLHVGRALHEGCAGVMCSAKSNTPRVGMRSRVHTMLHLRLTHLHAAGEDSNSWSNSGRSTTPTGTTPPTGGSTIGAMPSNSRACPWVTPASRQMPLAPLGSPLWIMSAGPARIICSQRRP